MEYKIGDNAISATTCANITRDRQNPLHSLAFVRCAYFSFPFFGFFFVLLTRFFFGGGAKLKAALHTGPLSWLRNSSSRSWSLVVGIGVVWPTESQP